jgi:hypothetical protein
MPMYGNPRDDIADSLMNQQRGAFDFGQAQGPLASGVAGLPQQAMTPMTGPTLAGLPTTPAGGVPGSGLATAGASNVQLPPQRMGMQGAMPPIGGLGMAPGIGKAAGLGGIQPMIQQRRRSM